MGSSKSSRKKRGTDQKVKRVRDEIKNLDAKWSEKLESLRDDINKKIMLNERDTIFLSVAALLGLLFSIIQIFPGDWTRFLTFVPLLILGWGMPLAIYVHRVVHKLSFQKSLIWHFRSRIYFVYSLIGYILTSMMLYKVNNVLTISVSIILFIIAAVFLHIQANGFFTLFGHKQPISFVNIFLRGYIAISSMIVILLSCSCFYLGYVIYLEHYELSLFLFIAGFALLAFNLKIYTQEKSFVKERKRG